MSDKKFELSRRRVLAGLGTIGVASAGAGAGTMALFSDSETSSGNTVQAGTLELSLGSSQFWTVSTSNLAPGDTISGAVDLTNDGSLDGDHIEVATTVTENDRSDEGGDADTGDPGPTTVGENLFVKELVYPDTSGSRDYFSAATQVPGAYVYDIDQSGTKTASVVGADDPADSGSTGVVHATSGGSASADYARSLVDVSNENATLNDLANNGFSYDYYPTGSNEVSAPDEVKLIVSNETGRHFIFQQLGPTGTTDQWNTRDLANNGELASGSNPSSANGWFVVDLDNGGKTPLGDSPLDEFGSANVELVGFGASNFDPNSKKVIDIYYDNLVVNGTSKEFRSSPMSVADIESQKLDNLTAPAANGGTETFTVDLKLNPEVGNDFQGDGVDISFKFGLAQESSQGVL